MWEFFESYWIFTIDDVVTISMWKNPQNLIIWIFFIMLVMLCWKSMKPLGCGPMLSEVSYHKCCSVIAYDNWPLVHIVLHIVFSYTVRFVTFSCHHTHSQSVLKWTETMNPIIFPPLSPCVKYFRYSDVKGGNRSVHIHLT